MRIDFQGLNSFVVEPGFIDHARPRLEGLLHFSDRLRECRVAVSLQRGRYRVEITSDINGQVFRSETRDNDLLTAFDAAQEKIERQLTAFKGKRVRLRKQGPRRGETLPEVPAVIPADAEDEELMEYDIIRTKSHAVKPMSPQEAVLQMEMVGHDFYVFRDDTTDHIQVVYRRRNGGYGLIVPTEQTEEEEE